MNDSMFDLILTAMYIGCGGYCIYTYFIQKKAGELLANKILCPNNGDPKTCKKPEEYIRYMLPRILILGIGMMFFGGLFLLNRYFGSGSMAASLALTTVPLVLLIWYAVIQRKAVKLYWQAGK